MTENKKGRIFKKGGGCDEDCFNCPYPDCYKPALQMKKEKTEPPIRERKSRPHMYTVMLGGVGRDKPNIARQFWR